MTTIEDYEAAAYRMWLRSVDQRAAVTISIPHGQQDEVMSYFRSQGWVRLTHETGRDTFKLSARRDGPK